MSSLADSAKKTLLEVARRAVVRAVESRELLDDLPRDEILQEVAGAFVTLHTKGRLRGCVGQLAANDPLVSVVAYCAMAAALEDPRFSPMSRDELRGFEIEISVLSPLFEVSPEQIEAGKHGLMVSRGGRRGVLLPQVATEHGWSAVQLLEATCEKAGLERDAWKQPETRIQAFTAEVFSELDANVKFSAEPRAKIEPAAGAKSGYSTST
jgi:AmmeMemoRadiSam system protein A